MPVEAELQKSIQDSPLQIMRHSAAYVMAEAVQEMFPGAKFGIGRATEDGFYYDFDLPRSLTPGDFPEIEQRIARTIAGKYTFVREHWSRLKALDYFRSKGQLYKVELIENLPDEEEASVYQQQNDFHELCRVQESGNWPDEVMICQQHNFLDLCLGPHVEHTGQIGPFKLMSVAGAYWLGDEKRPMLQRLYGTAWFTQEAGFYGPKLDFVFRDALNREWQLGTVQVDYNLPERFDLWYTGEDGQCHRPVMIHRAPGSVERLVAILIEHYAGAFPAWLAPLQAMIIPIADRHLEYAYEILEALKEAGVRTEVDKRSERMNAKIREAQLQKIPYMLVVGDKEQQEHTVSVRLRTNENLGRMPLAVFIERILEKIKARASDL